MEIINAYFRDRELEFIDRDGLQCRRRIRCGVPQGSVFGPLLWDLAFDSVLRLPIPRDCHVCYADDTLVVATGEEWGNTIARAEMAVTCVVRKITDLGLKVATHKTEALGFYSRASGKPPEIRLRFGDTSVLAGARIKYLGLLLDGMWRFGHHFDALAPKIQRVATALAPPPT